MGVVVHLYLAIEFETALLSTEEAVCEACPCGKKHKQTEDAYDDTPLPDGAEVVVCDFSVLGRIGREVVNAEGDVVNGVANGFCHKGNQLKQEVDSFVFREGIR